MAIKFNRSQTFATNGTVDAPSLHNLVDGLDIYQSLITDQTNVTSVSTADELLIAIAAGSSGDAPKAVTVQELFQDALTAGTYTNANISAALTYGTATGTRLVSDNATITTGTITTAVIPTLTSSTATFGTTTSTAATITSGTVTNLASTTGTIATLNSTTGTIATLNSTTGTIGNLSTTLAGDVTISQGTATLGTSGVTAGTYGGASSIPTIVVDNKGRVTTASTSALTTGYTGFRNRIINGDMRIDQRNAGASVTANTSFAVDRFQLNFSNDGACSLQQSSTAPSGFTNSIVFTTTTADASLGSTQYTLVTQRIEGHNVSDLGFGTSGASSVALSFWVRSSLTGTFGGSLQNNTSDRNYPFAYEISSANTWEKKTISIAGDTSGTWLTNNGVGFQLHFGLGSGSSYSGTAGSWTSSNVHTVTGAVSVIGTLNATWYITGVQLEAGSTATDFERRPYGTELAMCQRYFIRYINRAMGTMNGPSHLYNGSIAFPVTMRSAPTLVSGASFAVNAGSAGTPALDPTSTNNSAITTVDQAIFWNSSSNWTSNNFASITCSLTSEL